MYKKKNEILDLINRGGKHSRKTKKKLSGRMLFSEFLMKNISFERCKHNYKNSK